MMSLFAASLSSYLEPELSLRSDIIADLLEMRLIRKMN